MSHEWLTATTDMAVLPGVLGCRTLRRTVQVRLGSNTLRLPGGTPHLHGLVTAIHETSGLEKEQATWDKVNISRTSPLLKMKQKRFQVYGLGQCCLDYIGKVDSYPPPDVKCEFRDMVIQGGGPVATALVALAKWGVSCTFAGVIGDDRFGDIIKATLEDEKVDTAGLVVRQGSESQFAFILAEPSVGRRTIFWRRPTGPPPSPQELDYSTIRKAEVLHTDGLFPESSLAAAKAAKEAGVQVVVDGGSYREGMLDLARLSDYFLASESFSAGLVGEGEPLDACYKLAELGPRLVGVTLGPQGYVALVDGRIIKRPAYLVDPVDTTGCGDVFHAGFTYGLIKGWKVDKCLDFGAWTAARVSLELGGRAGIPPLEKIRNEGWLDV